MLGARLSESVVTSDAREAASVIAVNSGDKLDLYPLSTMFPEDLLHYGEANRVSMLSKQGHRSVSHLEGLDLVRGFLFDEDAMVVTYWGLCCELLPGHLERAWPGWKATDLEGDRETFERLISPGICLGMCDYAPNNSSRI